VGPDVEAAQVEDQEHLRRPAAQALDPGELLDHLVVAQLAQGLGPQRPLLDLAAEPLQVRQLLPRQAAGPQLLFRAGQDGPGRRVAPGEDGPEAPVDRGRGLARELLVDDRPDQRVEGPLGGAGGQHEGPRAVDDEAQGGVGAAQPLDGAAGQDKRVGHGPRG